MRITYRPGNRSVKLDDADWKAIDRIRDIGDGIVFAYGAENEVIQPANVALQEALGVLTASLVIEKLDREGNEDGKTEDDGAAVDRASEADGAVSREGGTLETGGADPPF